MVERVAHSDGCYHTYNSVKLVPSAIILPGGFWLVTSLNQHIIDDYFIALKLVSNDLRHQASVNCTMGNFC